VDAPREPRFLLASVERRALRWMAARLPRWVLPDHLTALALVAALGIGACYLAANSDSAWLWVVNALLVVHWLGDSLDGTLARVRGIERPRYGYYLDHLSDAIATALIGIGLGLSPHMLLSTGLVVVIAYLILSINTYLETHVFGVFTLGYGYVGPTEARVALFVLNGFLAAGVGLGVTVGDLGLGPFDFLGLGAAGIMVVALAVRAARQLRRLGQAEPSARRG